MSLMQKDVRDQRGLKADKGGKATKKDMPEQSKNFSIGYYIMKVGKVWSFGWAATIASFS